MKPHHLAILGLCASALAGCVTEQTGHEQTLWLSIEGSLSDEVAGAHVVIAAAELMPCRDGASHAARGIARKLEQWLVPTARAHSESHALRIGVPRRIALVPDDPSPARLGRFFAPAGAYCHVVLELGPADADAVGAGDGGVGETLQVRFGDSRPILRSHAVRTTAITLSSPLVIADPPETQRLTLRLRLDAWPVHDMANGDQALSVLTRAFSAP